MPALLSSDPGSVATLTLSGSTTCVDDRDFVAATDGHLHCVDSRQGRPFRKWDLGNPSVSSPAPVDNGLVEAAFAGELLFFQ